MIDDLTDSGSIAEILNPTSALEYRYHFAFQKGYYQDEKNKIFQQFKYPKLFAEGQDYSNGTMLNWECDTRMGKGMKDISLVNEQLDNIKEVIINWVAAHEDLDGLFTTNAPEYEDESFNIDLTLPFDKTDNIGLYKLPIIQGVPFWAAQIWGGTQGRYIQIKSLTKKENTIYPGLYYECEFIYTIKDNFGVGMSDGEKWNIPGVIEQWVLQHYRNSDCENPPCYIPITAHTVEVYHKFIFSL